jgi:hypothetical protein
MKIGESNIMNNKKVVNLLVFNKVHIHIPSVNIETPTEKNYRYPLFTVSAT